MDFIEKKEFSMKIPVDTHILRAGERYSVFCKGDTDFSFKCLGESFQFKLWDSHGLIVNSNQGFITSSFNVVLTE